MPEQVYGLELPDLPDGHRAVNMVCVIRTINPDTGKIETFYKGSQGTDQDLLLGMIHSAKIKIEQEVVNGWKWEV